MTGTLSEPAPARPGIKARATRSSCSTTPNAPLVFCTFALVVPGDVPADFFGTFGAFTASGASATLTIVPAITLPSDRVTLLAFAGRISRLSRRIAAASVRVMIDP